MDISKHIKPLRSQSDWPIWKRKIRDLLDYHEGALDVIDRKLVKPGALTNEATEEEIRKHKEKSDFYRKANSYAKSMITSAITDEIYQKIMDKELASDAWEALKLQFEATSKDQLFQICKEFFAFTWIQGEDVSFHIAKLRNLWNELNIGLQEKNENRLPDLMLVCKTLQILPHDFESFQSSWMLLTKDDSKTFDELTTQLCIHERNFLKNNHNENNDKNVQNALVANAKSRHQKINEKGKFHKSKFKVNDVCNYCKQKGHWLKDCQKWVLDGKPSRAIENKSGNNKLAFANTMFMSTNEACFIESDPTEWWIDNGATKHVTNCPTFFKDFEKFDNTCGVRAAGKEILNAVGKGTITISTVGGQSIDLVDVWYVPEVTRNLFSVLAAQDKNPNSLFRSSATECWLQINNKTVLRGKRELNGTLFKAAIRPVFSRKQNSIELNVLDNKSLLQLYHGRWGHQDKRHVKEVLIRELGIDVPLDTEICEPCIYGKAHRLPFGHREKVNKPGELMSADICGPFEESYQKKKYLLLFKDAYTKFKYGFIVKEKSEVKDLLKQVIQHSKTLGHNIKEFLSDNGGEFDCKEVKAILSAEGIQQRLTAPYTPQQNGASERELRTVVEMARTFKYSNENVEFPAAMWAELVATSIYILNRTGKSSVDGKSPYELWIGKKPRIKHLRIIGSTCYVHVPMQKRKKMDSKAVKGYLVGYDGDERYRVWIQGENKVILSRDVIFKETISNCQEETELPFRDNEHSNEGKQSEIDNNESQENIESEEESEDDIDKTSQIKLRDRSKLRKPIRLDDYIMMTEEFINGIQTPETFIEAVSSKQALEWRKAMQSELRSLEENGTWDLVSLPKGAKVIPCKWVYRIKTNPDGTVDKYKARLVVKGYRQRYGIDYKETFCPVAKMSTVRTMMSIAASENLHLMQFDVSTAFLYGELEEAIFMKQPEGFEDNTEQVCKLKRSLYGLKQSPRCWNKRFGGFLELKGFKPNEADPCLYVKEENGKKLFIALYVDDGLVMANDQQQCEIFIEELKAEFKITIKQASYFLGLEIENLRDGGIKICQQAYARKILERFNFHESKPVSTPIIKELQTNLLKPECTKKSNFPYRQAVGSLMYLMIGTRPDLAYSVSFLSRSLDSATEEDVIKLKRVLRYLAGTTNLGIVYKPTCKSGILECYSDADFGGCNKTGRSTSGVVIIHAGGAVSWLSQRQGMTATSTTEAELVATHEAVKEIIWLRKLFQSMTELKEVPVLQVDNQSTVRLCHNPEFHRRTKHINIKYFFIREKVVEGDLDVQYVSTENQLADIMTKPLPNPRLQTLCKRLGLLN